MAFKILRKNCCGLDVHKTWIYACIGITDSNGRTEYKKDAKWICDLYMCGMVKPSFIPPPDIRQLRDLMRYRVKLTNMLTGEKNRAHLRNWRGYVGISFRKTLGFLGWLLPSQ